MSRIFFAPAFIALLALTPAQAQDKMDCSQAEMTKMETKMKTMSDGESKKMAMKEMQMAESMMKKNDMKGCMTHMQGAMKAMEKK